MATGSTTHPEIPIVAPAVPIPRLEPGDRLTRAEFERRYDAMPDLKKAELIEGTVYMPSPVRMDAHGGPHADLLAWFGMYRAATPGVRVGGDTSLKLDQDNMPQPDALLMIEPSHGGQAIIDKGGYIQGAPELVAEVSSSSVSIDLNDKLNAYRRNGVREYVAWRVLDRAIDWFILRDGQYFALALGDDGLVRSEVFPGLWLNVAAMLDARLDMVLAALQQGITTPEHNEFVKRLGRKC